MSRQEHLPAPHSIFRDDEPLIQTQPLLPGARSPLFGDRGLWDFNGVVERPANRWPTDWRIPYLEEMPPAMNLLARELAMIWFNPRHPAVLAKGIHLSPTWRAVSTVKKRFGILQQLSGFGGQLGLEGFAEWSDDDFKGYLAWHRELTAKDKNKRGRQTEEYTNTGHVRVIKDLYQFRRLLAGGGPRSDPWPGISARKVLELGAEVIRTKAIVPEAWFPLVKDAWAYIDVFSADILKASANFENLQQRARRVTPTEGEEILRRWLADPNNRVPVRLVRTAPRTDYEVNWTLLTWMVGLSFSNPSAQMFNSSQRWGRVRRRPVEEAVARGQVTMNPLVDPVKVARADGSRGPWHPSLQGQELWIERTTLRNACLVFCLALSMMRDNEVRAVLRDSVVEYYSSPAVKSTKRKLTPDLPTKHWWIIRPVAKSIDIASQLSVHPELAFAAINEGEPDAVIDTQKAILSFVRAVNIRRQYTGLAEIPKAKITPHMFRKTMAMLTRDFPGSEIATGMQLKHVATRALANRITQGYMEKDPSWAKYLEDAITDRRFDRLKELYDADGRGESVGFGPGAERMRATFAAVRHKAEQFRSTGKAQRGDKRVEYDLLRRTKFSIRFGKLNHCTMDDDNPVGAKCIEDAVVPEGHRGPLHDRCRPSRCGNSFVTIDQIPIWKAEHGSLSRLRGLPNLPRPRRDLIDEQLADVEIVLRRVNES
ncbi:hypothetical protein [Streptomyces bacillaris]|uniref:hypothetical protein n=1 Tax=Streptomyces bacillaris TaxID=68179 RepID=UPI003D7107C3